MGGAALVETGNAGPTGALRFGSRDGLAVNLAISDVEPVRLAVLAAELEYQSPHRFRAAAGARIDGFTLCALPAARIQLPVGNDWVGFAAALGSAEGAPAYQFQFLLDLSLYAAQPAEQAAQ